MKQQFRYVGEENHRPGHGLDEVANGDTVEVDDAALIAELDADPRWKHVPAPKTPKES